ncbi:TonB-dependent receptor [Formosa agariphila KMM 3901]|uniref:TonB-dependent receptor n=1 Tax=Formosa agariphila (strain DSM 15362 / KCTC 12365 / LMG 23005 / KMM 3901 / M-2Alg 35-1) TaxID=1347342 RepID=T2KQU1_FORAG|nr:TonB-dependent receptor [Formosa agariphila]CDF81110.1 TonB-dependent receptor [Formosa agariphila KMM 3901]
MVLNKGHFTFLLFLISCVAFSQKGELNGNVVFDTNEPVLGAHIILIGIDLKKETVTGINGDYSFKNIPFGTYNIQMHSLNANSVTIEVVHDSSKDIHNTVIKFSEYQDLAEILVKSKTTKEKIEDEGFAVNVIETKEAGLRNVQTNELLRTSAGVNIRQNGGLGSDVQYSLNGLSGSAVRIFIDGIPISVYGSSFSLNSIPPSMIKRIEVYKGVVPGYLADDALGGAINIVLHKGAKNNLNASISYGSFNTLQTSLNGLYRFDKSGFTVKASGFYNSSDNDYKVSGRSVVVTGLGGVQTPITARRFNDAYRSVGGMAQIGFTDVKWADQFFIGLTGSDDYKEVQHGAFMTITPYKDRFLESDAALGSLTYQKKDLFTKGLDINVHGVYGTRNRVVNDTMPWAYSWAGERAIDYKGDEFKYIWNSQQEGGPTLATIKRNVASVRSGISYTINDNHKVLVNHVYSGIDREDSDALQSLLESTFVGTRDLNKNITSFTYELNAFDDRLKANIFWKYYQQKTTNSDPDIENDANGNPQIVDVVTISDNKDNGYGFALSYDVIPNVSLLVSAEKAIRLPDETEVFGNDGDNVVANPSIQPEKSKNYNLGFRLGTFNIEKHAFSISTNFFIRDMTDRIGLPIETSLNVDDETILYVNQGNAKSKGVDAQLDYTYNNNFGFNFNISNFDLTTETALGTEINIPNTPFFTMNSSFRYSFQDIFQKKSQLNLYYVMNFTDKFSYLTDQGSNTVGNEFFEVPQQFAQDFGASYAFPNNKLVVSFDIKNIFDEAVYDNLSVQKPGRAFYLKLNYTINKF